MILAIPNLSMLSEDSCSAFPPKAVCLSSSLLISLSELFTLSQEKPGFCQDIYGDDFHLYARIGSLVVEESWDTGTKGWYFSNYAIHQIYLAQIILFWLITIWVDDNHNFKWQSLQVNCKHHILLAIYFTKIQMQLTPRIQKISLIFKKFCKHNLFKNFLPLGLSSGAT